MCLPMGIIATVAGLAGTALQVANQMSVARKNEQSVNDWAAYQSRMRQEEGARQENARAQADVARQEGLQEVAPQAMIDTQASEAERLNEDLGQAADKVNVSDALLSGQKSGSQVFQDTLASKLAGAATEARSRIKALAGLQAFGGSSGGLDYTTGKLLQETGNKIDLANNKRTGSLGAYGAEKAVNPVQYFGNPLANAMGSLPANMFGYGMNQMAQGGGVSSFFG